MGKISLFMITDNPIKKGYPIVQTLTQVKDFVDEIVVVDLNSTDGTLQILKKFKCVIYSGDVDYVDAFKLYRKATHPTVLWIEPNEVISDKLIRSISGLVNNGIKSITFFRIEIEQNFKRIRWYPHKVHRVFQKSKNIECRGVTTNKNTLKSNVELDETEGLLWACFNNFAYNWMDEIHDKDETSLVPNFYTQSGTLDCTTDDLSDAFEDNVWSCSQTVLRVPPILNKLIGVKKYVPEC